MATKTESMPYDHSTKIGNQGDVVKHIAHFAALRPLLKGRSADGEFVYADIHAGRPDYVLPEKGEWQYGIGPFSDKPEIVEDPASGGRMAFRASGSSARSIRPMATEPYERFETASRHLRFL